MHVFNDIEKSFGIKCFHNEMKIILLLDKHGECPSLDIQNSTGRSISAHNTDLKRLMSLGYITCGESVKDRRRRVYSLTESGRALAKFAKTEILSDLGG